MPFPTKKKNARPVPLVRRLPGQAIRDAKERLTDDWPDPSLFSAAFLWLLWLAIEMQARSHHPPNPQRYLCLAIAATYVGVLTSGKLTRYF
jgi:hypothetical protein